mgnify:CR=1 FL=1
MKKKILKILLSTVLIVAMATGCSGASEEVTDSGESKTEVESEVSVDDQQTDDVTSEEDTVEGTDSSSAETDEKETPDVVLTADTEIMDEDIQEIYASIEENVTSEYLEPNGIDPADFSWPSSESSSWYYFDDLYTSCYLCIDLKIPFTKDELSEYEGKYPAQDKELFDAVFFGILNWMDSKGSYDTGYFSAVLGKLNPYASNLPANVTFT